MTASATFIPEVENYMLKVATRFDRVMHFKQKILFK